MATQPISLVVGFTYGLAPHIAYWRERERGGREKERERERVYVLTKKQGTLNPCQKAEIVTIWICRGGVPRQPAPPPPPPPHAVWICHGLVELLL